MTYKPAVTDVEEKTHLEVCQVALDLRESTWEAAQQQAEDHHRQAHHRDDVQSALAAASGEPQH